MAIDAFVLWHQLEGWEFAEAFLSSPDFDIDTHKAICQNLKLPKNGTKGVLVSRIVGYGRNSFNKKISEIIVQQLVIRNKIWFTIKTGTINITQLPKCGEPAELLFSSGQEQWYGPIKDPIDECVSWYIRPVFIPHFGRLRN